MVSFQDNLGKLVSECPTILDCAEARDNGAGGSDNLKNMQSSSQINQQTDTHFLQTRCRPTNAPKAKIWNNKSCSTLFSAKYIIHCKKKANILLRNAGNTGSDFQPNIKNRSYHLCQILVETGMSVTRQSVST